MGSSRSVENVRLKQTQEIELARSISEIEGVVTARVHLAIPEKSVFAEALYSTHSIGFSADGKWPFAVTRQQVDVNVHLVSSSVPFMAKNDVTVVDQYGNLLSRPPQDSAGTLSDAQLEHRIRLEDIYRNRVIALVSPIVGAGNVTAQVNLNIDFTRSEITEELMDPEGNALRSEQRSSESSAEIIARGCPVLLATALQRKLILARSSRQITIIQTRQMRAQPVKPVTMRSVALFRQHIVRQAKSLAFRLLSSSARWRL